MPQPTVKRASIKKVTTKNRIEIPSAATSFADAEFYKKVQEKAYELYVARGCVNGYDVEDWVAAEKIVRGA